jgi:hypothetical protein
MPEVFDSLPKSVYEKSDDRTLAERMGYLDMMSNFPGKWVLLLSVKKKKRQKIYNMASYFNKTHPECEFRSISKDTTVNLYGRLIND